jgi:protein-tyrosine phosphatase
VIDLHSHLLPAVDDGAASPEVTAAMLAKARDTGFTTMVATPHLPGPLDPIYRERVEAAYEQTRAMASAVGVEVRLGYEVALTPDLPDRLQRGEPSTLGGGTAVLVDVPFAGWPHHADETLFALQVAGFQPILAHPERYGELQRDLSRAAGLAERGVVLQVTIGSLAGVFGKATQRTAEQMLRQGLVHLVATDAHSAGHRFAAVPSGLRKLGELVGEERLRQLVEVVPRALLDGHPLPIPVPVGIRNRRDGWLSGFVEAVRGRSR